MLSPASPMHQKVIRFPTDQKVESKRRLVAKIRLAAKSIGHGFEDVRGGLVYLTTLVGQLVR